MLTHDHPGRAAGRLAAAIATWAVVFTLTLAALYRSDAGLRALVLPAAVLQLVLLTAMLGAVALRRTRPRLAGSAFVAQLAAALTAGWLLPVGWLPIYTIVWVAMLPAFLASRRGAFLLLGMLLISWYLIQKLAWQDPQALADTLLWGVFHLFALISALETRAAHRARDEVATLNRELVGNRHLLEEASRSAERTRIARDLHDLLGHHLTALSLQLQVAARQADGALADRLQHCHALSRLLLADVREAVSHLREDTGMDLAAALRAITAATPALEVHLDVPPTLTVPDFDRARALLRCVQEALTNTLRHADARNVWIRVRESGRGLGLEIHDDGHLRGPLTPGNGLRGMRERVQALAGELHLGRRDGALSITVTLPSTAGTGA